MSKIFSTLTILPALVALLFGLSSCRDEEIWEEIGEGETQLSLTVKYQPLASALDTRTPGNAIKNVNSLCVLIYNSRNEYVNHYNIADLKDFKYDNGGNTSMPNDSVGRPIGPQAEDSTYQASFKIPDKLPYGRYYIYCVANMGDITKEQAQDIKSLRATMLDWQPANIAANNQMYGYFTRGDDTNGGADGFDARLITLREPSTDVHAWIKRAASKLTVAFDGSGLHQNVWVYVKSVTLHDIPKQCHLGEKNTPDSPGALYNRKGEVPVANSILYYNKTNTLPSENSGNVGDPGDNYLNWMRVANGLGDKNNILGSTHSETANALYFYENNQGNYDGQKKYDKRQDPNQVGTNITEPGQPDYKDAVEYGSYIEVEAYYVSTNVANTSSGPIKYRFMLGKDVKYDYDAARNNHFKLTLGFNGWANQPDWHIEYYEPDPGLYVPESFRVSYLYNQKAMMPIKIVGNCTDLKMEIIENSWAPCDSIGNLAPSQPGSGHGAFRWASHYYSKYNPTDYPYLGFLALRVPGATMKDVPTNVVDDMSFDAGTEALSALNTYYTSNGQDERTFTPAGLSPTGGNGSGGYEVGTNNAYQVHQVDHDSKMLFVPLFTRNKTMILSSGYSGNNPYEAYYRKAVVRISATFHINNKDTVITKDVEVYQVPRLTNPKGVWRAYNSDDDFRVNLVQLPTGNATSYESFESQGYWKAYVEIPGSGVDFVKLYTTQGEDRTYMKGDTIIGRTSTLIDFGINFVGKISSHQSKCAVVRIDYHGGSCVHRIMLRQGYLNPLAVEGNTQWSSFCLVGATYLGGADGSSDRYSCVITNSPLQFGSFFRRGRQTSAILASNNTVQNLMVYQAPGNTGFALWNRSNKLSWAQIGFRDDRNTSKRMGTFISSTKIDGYYRQYRVPTYDDFMALTRADYGFGVLYGDGALVTQVETAKAWGFDGSSATVGNGSRGIVVYNQTNANQIFFPVGVQGMGRRRQFNISENYYGSLWYSDVNDVLAPTNANNQYRPIAYNLPAAPGAIYWIDQFVPKNLTITGNACLGWDINYFNFDFNPYTINNYRDGCPIKLIYTGKTSEAPK